MIGRPNGRDITLLQKHYREISCDGFEFMMYDTWYDTIDHIRHVIETIDAPFPVFHVEKSIGSLVGRGGDDELSLALFRFEINCALAHEMGAEILVFHLWNGPESDKNIERNITYYAQFREIAEAKDLVLTVENVVCNQQDPLTHMRTLVARYPDVSFTFDTKMAAFHSQMNELYKEEHRGIYDRIRHIHANDYSGGYMDWSNLKTLHIGNGSIGFDRFFAFVKDNRYQGDFTIEATSFDQDGVIHCDRLNRSIDTIRALINR